MEGNWRQAANAVEKSRHDSKPTSHWRKPSASASSSNSTDPGSGFARNCKFNGKKNRSTNIDIDNKTITLEHEVDNVKIGDEYECVVKAVKMGKEGGTYCHFSDDVSNREGFIPKLFFNAKEKRRFKKGDRVKVFCTAIHPTVIIWPLPEYIRPLLILDINGPLGERSAFVERESSRKRTFLKRNHLDEFLSIVREKFEIGVWSCSTRKNIELNLFSDINLLFVWSQEQSTSLYPRTSFVTPAKPLFLKEISKVWHEFPCFNSSNTLLVDNHIEKFERNEFGTGIIVPDQGECNDDDVLSPNGELCHHLLGMLCETPMDIRNYVIKRSGTSKLFPSEYPVPPKEDSTEDHRSRDSVIPNKETLVWNYILAVCNNNSNVARTHTSKKSLPGPKASPLHRRDISAVVNSDYVVCEKTDGERAILVVDPKHSLLYFVKRDLTVQMLNLGNKSNEEKLNEWLSALNGLTVLDGELVSEYCIAADARSTRHAFLCFDAVIVNGDFIGKNHDLTLLDRISVADSFLSSSPLYMFAFSMSPIFFKCKYFATIEKMSEVVSCLSPTDPTLSSSEGGWVYETRNSSKRLPFPHASDGLVFTPVQGTYYDYIALKWKPPQLCTVDFSLSIKELDSYHQKSCGPYAVVGSVASGKGSLLPLNEVILSYDQVVEFCSNCPKKSQQVVVECSFDACSGQWEAKKLRVDRPSPNSLRTAWSNLEVIAESISLDDLRQEINRELNTSRVSSIDVSAVSKHYDLVQEARQTGAREERIAVHRKVMNWAKACLFKAAIFYTSKADDHSIDSFLSALQQQHQDFADGNIRFPELKRSDKKQRKSSKRQGPSINVLDLACGRGGDNKKFTSDNVVELYVGVDISKEQLKDCAERVKSNRRIKKNVMSLSDASDGTWKDGVKQATSWSSCICRFDISWCMFALHYFCDSEETLRNLFSHVAEVLKFGGKFVSTFPNPYFIHHKLTQTSRSKQVDDEICKVEWCEDPQPMLALEDCLVQFGIPYKFSLGDAVQECKEYIVPLQKVLEIASEVGLKVGCFDTEMDPKCRPSVQSMNSWIQDFCLNNDEMSSLRSVMGVSGPKSNSRDISAEEWEAISLYTCAVWTKVS